jgi:hypothetical protein
MAGQRDKGKGEDKLFPGNEVREYVGKMYLPPSVHLAGARELQMRIVNG